MSLGKLFRKKFKFWLDYVMAGHKYSPSPSSPWNGGIYQNKNPLYVQHQFSRGVLPQSLNDPGWQRLCFDKCFTSTGGRDMVYGIWVLNVSLALLFPFHWLYQAPQPCLPQRMWRSTDFSSARAERTGIFVNNSSDYYTFLTLSTSVSSSGKLGAITPNLESAFPYH